MYRGFNYNYEQEALVIRIVKLFINDKLSYREIGKIVNILPDRVETILNNDRQLKVLFDEETIAKVHARKEEIQKGLEQSKANQLDLSIMAKDPKYLNNLVVHLALTFRANSETIQELFGINVGNLKWGNAYEGFLYLEGFDSTNQELVKQRIRDFYNAYKKARLEGNKEELVNLIRQISDYRAKKVREREIGQPYSDEDILALINYQIKYGLTNDKMEKVFSLDRDIYARKVQALLTQEGYEELRVSYEHLASYNETYRQFFRRNVH